MVHAYKYNRWLYRTVEYPYVLYENDQVICLYLPQNKINLIKAKEITDNNTSKKFFFSRNAYPMVWFFFKNKWFNVIAILKEKNVHYYINLASPYFLEEGAIKYIDFDLDIKINGENQYKIVDKKEFEVNSKKWKYPKEILDKITAAQDEIIALIEEKWFEKLLNPEEISYLKKYIDEIIEDKN